MTPNPPQTTASDPLPAATVVHHPNNGVAIQCQYCSGQDFRRSRVRSGDFKYLVFMRYPVRCLRCSQRQWVNFTVAGLAVPSHIRHKRPEKKTDTWKDWTGSPAHPGPSPATPAYTRYGSGIAPRDANIPPTDHS